MQIREVLKASLLPSLDAELLLAYVLEKPRTWLIAHDNQPLTASDITQFEQLASRRRNSEPVAYILGEREFYGRMFKVTRDVLIPRPATEELVRLALEFLQSQRFIECEVDAGISVLAVPLAPGVPEIILDIGTGSGCIAATLRLQGRKEKILAVDVSQAALDIARENFSVHNIDVVSAQGDGPTFAASLHQPFIIVSNPPYIAEGTVLQTDIARYEPPEALFAGKDGMDMLRGIAHAANDNPQCLGVVLELETAQVVTLKRLLGVM